MIEDYSCYLSKSLDKPLSLFFENVFKSFHKELHLLADNVYQNKPDKIFQYIERTWVGVFNNAVRRAYPDAVTLEEFSVGLENSYGRADYFVRLPDHEIDMLFEAKMYEDMGNDKNEYTETQYWYNEVINQARSYYNAEATDYLPNTYAIALIFGWMRKPTALQRARAYMQSTDEEKAKKDPTDFCAFFTDSKNGLWVYGKVEKAKVDNGF